MSVEIPESNVGSSESLTQEQAVPAVEETDPREQQPRRDFLKDKKTFDLFALAYVAPV
jgi:hypothetical protein